MDSYNKQELTSIQLRYMLTIRLADCIAALLAYQLINDCSDYHLKLLHYMSQLLIVTWSIHICDQFL